MDHCSQLYKSYTLLFEERPISKCLFLQQSIESFEWKLCFKVGLSSLVVGLFVCSEFCFWGVLGGVCVCTRAFLWVFFNAVNYFPELNVSFLLDDTGCQLATFI